MPSHGRLRAVFLAAALLIAGCDDPTRPDPPPVADLTITADGGYRLDDRPLAADRLDRELTRRANEAMNDQLGRTRLQIRIRFAPSIDYQRVLALQERCVSLGIAQVEVQR